MQRRRRRIAPEQPGTPGRAQRTRSVIRAASICFGPSPALIRATSRRRAYEITDSVSARVLATKQKRPSGLVAAQPGASSTSISARTRKLFVDTSAT
jgi:hypothetical protein